MTFHLTKNSVFWQKTADTRFIEERFEKTAEVYLQVCELALGTADAWAGRGKSLMHLDRYADAVDCFERSLAIKLDDVDIVSLLGLIYQKLGDAEKATTFFVCTGELQ